MKKLEFISISAHTEDELIKKINVALKMEGYDTIPEDSINKLKEKITARTGELSTDIYNLPFLYNSFYVIHQGKDTICTISMDYYGLYSNIVFINIQEKIECGFKRDQYRGDGNRKLSTYSFYTFVPNKSEYKDKDYGHFGSSIFDIKKLVVNKDHLLRSIEKEKIKRGKSEELRKKSIIKKEHFVKYSKIKIPPSKYYHQNIIIIHNKLIRHWEKNITTTITAPANWNSIGNVTVSSFDPSTRDHSWFNDWKKHKDFIFHVSYYDDITKAVLKKQLHFIMDGNKLTLNGQHFDLKTKDEFMNNLVYFPLRFFTDTLDGYFTTKIPLDDTEVKYKTWTRNTNTNAIPFSIKEKELTIFGEKYKMTSQNIKKMISLTHCPHSRTDRHHTDIYSIALKLKNILPITMDEIIEKINLTNMAGAI